MTPEGRTKRAINKVLEKYKGRIYRYMPVPSGYGATTLDYLGCFCGRHFAIEAKRPGGEPTDRQWTVIDQIVAAGGSVFVIDSEDGTHELEQWLEEEGQWQHIPQRVTAAPVRRAVSRRSGAARSVRLPQRSSSGRSVMSKGWRRA